MPAFGKLLTFNEFIKTHTVEIPRIQRDYTYGAGTVKTEKVIEKLLVDIYNALTNPDANYLILDFVYGCENQQTNYEPLDGQQRLTTLFLLHIYAAWKAKKDVGCFKFRYATRDNTSSFCSSITDSSLFQYNPELGRCGEQIRDCSFFLSSFGDDPSIVSMLRVLDKIEDHFADLAGKETDNLWDKLVDENCKVRFYCLDFGTFNEFKLSNDLYIKMNSRGKTLTDYEIFKSQIEKYIETALQDKDLMYRFAKKFDTDFTDLVWHELLLDKNKIDSALINLFKNLFVIINYRRKNFKRQFAEEYFIGDYLSGFRVPQERGTWFLNSSDIVFILDFLDVFHDVMKVFADSTITDGTANDQLWSKVFYSDKEPILGEDSNRIRTFKTEVNVFRTAMERTLRHPEVLMLYSQYYFLKTHPISDNSYESVSEWTQSTSSLRHIRNLIEASDNELRPEFMSELLADIEKIVDGNILEIESSKFNTIQFNEEKVKAQFPDRWAALYKAENHDILRGSISLFAGHDAAFNLGDDSYKDVLRRLEIFVHIFDENAKNNDRFIRASLLSVNDYTQKSRVDINHNRDNRMFGIQYYSWRELFKKSEYFIENHVIETLDLLDSDTPLQIQSLSTRDWRYYATRKEYYDYTYLAYGAPAYGYIYFMDVINRPLEGYLLQSTNSYDDNVMWKLLNRILWERIWHTRLNEREKQQSFIGNRKYSPEINICQEFKLDCMQDGWRVLKDNAAYLYEGLVDKGFQMRDDVVLVPDDTDYVAYGLQITDAVLEIISLHQKNDNLVQTQDTAPSDNIELL